MGNHERQAESPRKHFQPCQGSPFRPAFKGSGKKTRCRDRRCPRNKGTSVLQAIDWRALEEKRLPPPFKPAVNGLLDTKYFDSEFTGQSVALTPPSDQGLITSITEEEEFDRFSYQPEDFNRFSFQPQP